MPELDGQIALVTGGGRGIGANIARELASAGARVAVAARTSDQLEELALAIDALPVVADVSRPDSVETLVRAVESGLGPIDILCANAGIGSRDAYAWATDPDEWWRVFEVNVLGVYLTCRAVIPGMLADVVELCVLRVEGRRVALRGDPCEAARGADPGVHLLARARSDADDGLGAR